MELKKEIEEIILGVVEEALVFINDPDGKHLEAVVVSNTFQGCSLLHRSRKIMHALNSCFKSKLHALQLKTYTYAEWKDKG